MISRNPSLRNWPPGAWLGDGGGIYWRGGEEGLNRCFATTLRPARVPSLACRPAHDRLDRIVTTGEGERGPAAAAAADAGKNIFELPILAIDDQPADLEILADHLHDAGFQQVRTSVGGAAGVGVLSGSATSGGAPVVVVVDIRMPPPDGYEVLAHVKAMEPSCRPLALAVTGDSSPETKIAALQAGATDFITKPFDPVELLLRVRNLAELKWQERELERRAVQYKQLADEYRILADNAADIVVRLQGATVLRLKGTQVAWVSPSVQSTLGEPPERWIGSDFSDRVHPADSDSVLNVLQGMAPGKQVIERFRLKTDKGHYHWVDGHWKSYLDADGDPDGVIVALRIVDDQVETQQRLEQLAKFDTVTGLANRSETMTRFASALSNPRSPGGYLGVLFCDVDHFKAVNDNWGHRVGDGVLAKVGDRIRDCVRRGDTVGRIGGDEMLVLLPGVHDLNEVVQIAEKIRCCVSEPINYMSQKICVTVSIGATLTTAGESVTAVTSRADDAMYGAKNGGRNRVTRIDIAPGSSEGQ